MTAPSAKARPAHRPPPTARVLVSRCSVRMDESRMRVHRWPAAAACLTTVPHSCHPLARALLLLLKPLQLAAPPGRPRGRRAIDLPGVPAQRQCPLATEGANPPSNSRHGTHSDSTAPQGRQTGHHGWPFGAARRATRSHRGARQRTKLVHVRYEATATCTTATLLSDSVGLERDG
jgi:hypothetical protein